MRQLIIEHDKRRLAALYCLACILCQWREERTPYATKPLIVRGKLRALFFTRVALEAIPSTLSPSNIHSFLIEPLRLNFIESFFQRVFGDAVALFALVAPQRRRMLGAVSFSIMSHERFAHSRTAYAA